MSISHWICAGPAVALFIATAAFAASPAPDLGSQTAAIPLAIPLGGFHRAAPSLRSGHQPAILLYGASGTPFFAAESWALVKALQQFGTWSNLQQQAA